MWQGCSTVFYEFTSWLKYITGGGGGEFRFNLINKLSEMVIFRYVVLNYN